MSKKAAIVAIAEHVPYGSTANPCIAASFLLFERKAAK